MFSGKGFRLTKTMYKDLLIRRRFDSNLMQQSALEGDVTASWCSPDVALEQSGFCSCAPTHEGTEAWRHLDSHLQGSIYRERKKDGIQSPESFTFYDFLVMYKFKQRKKDFAGKGLRRGRKFYEL